MSSVIHECPHQKGVTCGWQECDTCGWNPPVARRRKHKARAELAQEKGPEREKWYIGSGPFPAKDVIECHTGNVL